MFTDESYKFTICTPKIHSISRYGSTTVRPRMNSATKIPNTYTDRKRGMIYEPLRVMIWAAVDYKGPRALTIMEENMNARNYKGLQN